MTRRYHKKKRPGGVKVKSARQAIRPGSKKKLSKDEIDVLIRTGLIKVGNRRQFETPFGGMRSFTITSTARAIWRVLNRRAARMHDQDVDALIKIQGRITNEWRKRNPDKSWEELVPEAFR